MIELAGAPDLLSPYLTDHLAQQRWAGAHGRPFASAVFRWHQLVAVDDAVSLVWALVDATHEDGGEVVSFQLFIGLRPVPPVPDFLNGKDRELIGLVDIDGEAVVAYDALVDPDLAIAVLHLVAPDVTVEVRRPLVLEHSNSSVVFDESRILKLFRRVEPGPNPDVEITRTLAAAGSVHVLAPLAELRREDTDLAVLREFLVGATEGWELARTSMRDLLASRLVPEDCGGDLAPDSERLGATIGELHVAMAGTWGHEPGDAAAWVARMHDQLAQVEAAAGAGEHLVHVDTDLVRAAYRSLAGLADTGTQMRIHGDLHLAQVIRIDAGWRVLDFEGEPARRRDDRFARSSPLRDVAGILRSFHYAAATGLTEWGDPDDDLIDLADAWEERNREAFLTGYFEVDALAELLPASVEARRRVLRGFEIDKAVYELGYELGYRPDKAWIPAAGIARLVADGGLP